MAQRWTAVGRGIGAAVLLLACIGCKAAPTNRPIRTSAVDTGLGSLEATRRALEGTWTLASLEVVDAAGARRPVTAAGTLTYDAFGNMNVKGVVEGVDKNSIVLDYDGKIIIDAGRKQFYSADLVSDRPADPKQVAPIAADKIRRYELTTVAFVVTYIDAAGKPTAVARWRR